MNKAPSMTPTPAPIRAPLGIVTGATLGVALGAPVTDGVGGTVAGGAVTLPEIAGVLDAPGAPVDVGAWDELAAPAAAAT